jgi:phage N-6-adenine-methyltransferase
MPTKNPYGRNGQRGQKKCTPRWFTDVLLNRGYDLQLDVCADAENTVAPRWYTETDNGLALPWTPTANTWAWCNPPFGNARAWIRKAVEEMTLREIKTLMLLPCTPGVRWWQTWHSHAAKIWLVVPRLNYYNPDTQKLENNVTYNSCLWEIRPQYRPFLCRSALTMEYLEISKPKGATR